ncbi:MAG TPA: MlaD family protein [Solirubrobacteraceae bacterium]|nr:MlaD family protein [Solirubrobacteraceae bacterium]
MRTGRVGSSRRGVVVAFAGALCAAALAGIVLLATAAGGSSGGYTVRAIFDDAGNIINGEDVKIDGVKVGTVGSVTATPSAKAAVTLEISNPGFQNFRADATCTIEPQALIGEKFVNCLPTQARPEGTPLPPPLHRIPSGREGAGQWLLPVTQTSSPVGIDQVGDITRIPESQALAIILNELGAGLTERGSDLNAVLHRSNPALREFEEVLGIFASQNKLLANLAQEGARALPPITRDRKQFAEFFAHANTVATAAAKQRVPLATDLHEFPVFLRQLGPALKRLDRFAEQTTPVFEDLGVAAPGIDKTFASIPGFAGSSTQFFKTFGAAAPQIGKSLSSTQPLLSTLSTLGTAVKPFAKNFSGLFTSLRSTGGVERLLDFIFLGTGATNGYNSLGHFIRADGVGALCAIYKVVATTECRANFVNLASAASSSTASAASTTSGKSVLEARLAAIARGESAAQAIAQFPTTSSSAASPSSLPTATLGTGTPGAQPVGGASAGTTYYLPPSESSEAGGLLLNYLLGE